MPDPSVRSLSRAVRPAVVLRCASDLLLVVAALSLAPPAVALLASEWRWLGPTLLPAALLGGAGLALRRGPAPAALQANEALAVTALVFVATPLAASIPFEAAGVAPLDAVFEAVSGVTTTGLSTLPGVEDLPRTLLFARAWSQWYGGLGMAVLSLAVVLGPGVASRRLLATTAETEDLLGSARPFARRVLGTYVALTAAGTLALWLAGGDLFDAVLHTLSAVSTGGFAPRDASLAGLGRAFQVGVLALCLAGAISLPLYGRVRRQGPGALARDVELRALLAAGAAGFALLWLLGHGAGGPGVLDTALLALSAQTTAGFATVSVPALDPGAKLVLVAAMIVGGSVGSTAGGMKLLRVLVAIQVTRWMLVRTRLPSHAVTAPTLAHEPLEREDVQRALAVIGLFAATLLVSWLAFLAGGQPPLDSLFEVASALGTVGLSTGLAAPELAAPLKAVLCADMLLGRLEIVAFLVVLSPPTWIGRRTD